jgi:hypothetical protein
MHILNPQKKFDKNIHHQTRTLKSEEKMNELYKNRQPMEILKGGGVNSPTMDVIWSNNAYKHCRCAFML